MQPKNLDPHKDKKVSTKQHMKARQRFLFPLLLLALRILTPASLSNNNDNGYMRLSLAVQRTGRRDREYSVIMDLN